MKEPQDYLFTLQINGTKDDDGKPFSEFINVTLSLNQPFCTAMVDKIIVDLEERLGVDYVTIMNVYKLDKGEQNA
jgi:hypothetical protein